ncbi:DUF11 domain-containing protein [Erythrobacter sp. YT30]|uniref:DUF11 domain-containing protein n=1 Tax=Erythrobacter sp. YT30 TaxID=1735012 RepID=UPI00076D0132|nr:DUF11 domain-containing protein [Erythrobacter sp. YT30]KWV90939.1 hypothetical protein AUC45_06290 [Erythrobacter sp. YT30]
MGRAHGMQAIGRGLGLSFANLKWLLIGFAALVTGTAASAADLQVTNYSVDPDPVAESAEADFTITAANNSAQAVNNAVVTINVPSNFEVAPADIPGFCTLSGAVGSQTLTCNLPNLVRNSPQTFTYTATALTSGANNTTATISAAGNTDSNPGNNSITITPTVRNGADLTVTKAGSAPSVIAGGQLTYTLSTVNNGPSTTAAVRVVDNLPAASEFEFQSAGGTNWSCSRSGTTVTCNYTGSAPAAGVPYPDITIVGNIVSDSAGTISNIASVEITELTTLDPDPSNNISNTVVTNVEPGSDLVAQKSMPSTITVGSSATIRLTISNTGPQTVPAGSTITDTIDSSLTIGAVPPGCSLSGQTVTCTAGSLNAPGQAVFDIPVTGDTPTGGTINNVATISPGGGFPDPDASNNTVSVPFQVVPANADLRLRTKNKFPNPVAPGQNITSRIFVRNDGPSVASYSAASPLIITDQLGPNETFISGPSDFDCTTAPNAGGTLVTCRTNTTGTLAVGSDIRLDLITQSSAGFNGTITNEACTDTTAGSQHTPSAPTSPSGDDCFSRGTVSTTSDADLAIDKSVSLSPTGPFSGNITIADTDNTFYIQLVARNRVGDPAANVRVRDIFPNLINSGGLTTGVTLQSAPPGATLNYQPNNNRADINITNLTVGNPQTIVLRVDRPFGSGSFINEATIFSADTTESDNSNNRDDARYTVGAVADMTVSSKSITPDPAQVGVPATYLISVSNDGANPAENVVVTDVIDPNLFDIVGTPTTTKPGGSCSVATGTGTVTCNLGQFIRDEIRQVEIDVLPKFPFGQTTVTNRATVETTSLDSNGGNDPNAGNNFFDLTHGVDPPEFDLAVTKVETDPATDDPIRFDETLNYDIRVSNFGPSRATDVLVTDIPAPPPGLTMTLDTVTINPVAANGGLSLQAAPNAGCSPSGGNVLCRIDTVTTANNFLDAGNQVIFRLTFTIGGTPPAGTVTFENAVEVTAAEQPAITGAGADTQLPNNRAVQNTTVLPSTDLEIVSKTRNGALVRSVNEPIEYVIRFRNNGPSAATEVIITDVLPSGFVFTNSTVPSTSIPGGSGASVSGINCTGTSTITCTVTGNFPAGAADTVDLSVFALAEAPYSGDVAPTNATNTATITPGEDSFGDPLSEDSNASNNSASADTQIAPSSLSGTVYADDNENDTIEAGEGTPGITVTLSGTDAFGNAVNFSTTTDGNGNFGFDNLPPSDANGYSLVETQDLAFYDRAETAGTAGGTVDNSTFGDAPAQNTISAIVLAASTDATGYIFQNRTNAVITADNDNPAPVNGATGGDDIINVLDNDTFNGSPADLNEIDITIVTPATPIGGGSVPVLDPATGLVDVPAGTPAGTYTIDYEICDEDDPDNCAPATVTVVVDAATIQAVDDNASGVNGLTGQANVLNVLTGDTLNGAPATTSNVVITVATGSSVPAGLSFDPATGNVSVDPGTPSGTYEFDYTICEILNPSNCSTATARVSVDAVPIIAVDDSVTGIDGQTGQADVLNVLDGDTLDGSPATTSNVAITVATGSSVPAGLTFDTATGSVSVDPGTPAGTYEFDYTICEILNPGNCSTATARVTVDAVPIIAVDDNVSGINGATGATDVLNVLDGDTLNGVPVNTSTVTITVAAGSSVPAGLTFDPATGEVSVDPGTAAGSYSFDYQICEILNPTNCAIATATVEVVAAVIEANPDTAPPTNGSDGGTGVINVLTNDTLNGDPADLSTVDISVTTPATPINGGPVPVLDPATGLVDVPPGTPAGDYVIEYQICEELNPTNCDTATITVPVIAAPIEANDDSVADIVGAPGEVDVLNVLTGDTLNGAPATTDNVTISVAPGSTVPTGLTFDVTTGNISVDPGTPAGDYVFDYEICETLNPTNCATATATVTVIAAEIEALDDSAVDIDSSFDQPNVLNVFDGDTIDGQPANATNAILSIAPGSSLPPGITFDPATGIVGVERGTPEGDYTFDYQICEAINPTNCTTATVTLNVVPSLGGVSGVVFLDENLNRNFEGGEPLQTGWTVQVVQNGEVVTTVQTDADGFYTVEDLPPGSDYEIRFFSPNGGAQFGSLQDVTITAGEILTDQNQPIDPSGVIYDAITRQPIDGAVVNLTDQFGNVLPDVCYIDPSQSGQITGDDGFYRFDIVAGADAACPVGRTEYAIQVTAPTGFADPISTIILPEDGALNVAGLGDPAAVVPNTRAPQVGDPTTYYLSFLIAQGDANVVNNHIPLDPFTTRADLLVTKTSTKRTASVGELVPYTITVRNTEAADRAGIDVVDILPPGFKYVPGSARVNDVPDEPEEAVRELRWEDQFLAGNATSTYSIIAVIGAGVSEGDRINTAVAQNGATNAEVSNRAQAVVTITASAIFDCAEIIGKVFDDFNGNGYQDEGEPGVPGARLATVNGELITVDEFGRYHITCAAVPNAQIGSNYVLKLDPRTIPAGYTPVMDNPQSIRLTRGKISELNFGIVKGRVVTIAIDDRAFAQGSADLKPAMAGKLAQLAQLDEQRLVIQVTYSAKDGEDTGLIERRLVGVRSAVDAVFAGDGWDGPPPTVETNMVRIAASKAGGE